VKNRMLQSSLFVKWQAVSLSPEVKWFFMGLQSAADDKNGNVCVEPVWLHENMGVKPDQTPDDFEAWVGVLIQTGWIEVYEGFGGSGRHAHIVGWKRKFSESYQSLKNPAEWTFPTETEPGTSANQLRSQAQKENSKTKDVDDEAHRVQDNDRDGGAIRGGSNRPLADGVLLDPLRSVPARKADLPPGGVPELAKLPLSAAKKLCSPVPGIEHNLEPGALTCDCGEKSWKDLIRREKATKPKLEKDPNFKRPVKAPQIHATALTKAAPTPTKRKRTKYRRLDLREFLGRKEKVMTEPTMQQLTEDADLAVMNVGELWITCKTKFDGNPQEQLRLLEHGLKRFGKNAKFSPRMRELYLELTGKTWTE
jgi:hypothetical protein